MGAEDGPEGFRLLVNAWGYDAVFSSLGNEYSNKCELAANKAIDENFPWNCLVFANPNTQWLFGWQYIKQFDAHAPNGFARIIPVVFAADNNYAVYTGVAIESIIANASPSNFYRIYIINTGINAEHIRTLEALSANNVSVRCLNIQSPLAARCVNLYGKAHYTKEMFYRFLIPEIFCHFPKVIYLDGDLIVETDIAAIIPENMGESIVAAVKNPLSDFSRRHIRSKFDLDADEYFNSGVLVMNTSNWLNHSATDRCFEYFRTIPKKILFCPDQDILNIVCKEHVFFLEPSWNYCWHYIYNDSDELKNLFAPVIKQVGNNFKLLHFAGSVKPWHNQQRPLCTYFWKYAMSSPFLNEILERNQPLENDNRPTNDLPSSHYIQSLKYRLEQAEKEIRNIRASASYRIGRFITWIPRKVRGLFRCCREHGWRYTCKRVLVHLHLK